MCKHISVFTLQIVHVSPLRSGCLFHRHVNDFIYSICIFLVKNVQALKLGIMATARLLVSKETLSCTRVMR